MRARGWLAGACLAASLAALTACGGGGGGPRSLIVVTLDTTRADRLGAYGGTFVSTPNLDRIAREGVLFEDAVSQVPLTLPSHSAMFTGRYPATLGVRHNGLYRLPEREVTLAERLSDAGYDTAGFVAAYVLNRGFGIEQGFARFDDVAVDRWEGGRDRLFEAQRDADRVNARVFEWLDRRESDAPVFLWVHYYDPHAPWAPPERAGRTLEGTGYDREISYVDACFGELIARLQRDGLLDSSVLIVAGDHGEGLGEHEEEQHGFFLYDSTIRVPLMIRAPGVVPEGARVRGPVELVDLAPTALDLLGLPPLGEAQGVSLVPRIDGREAYDGRFAYAESLMARLDFGWSELRMIRNERYKYIEAPTPELYDLSRDPGETINLATDKPERAREFASLLAEWMLETTDVSAEGEAGRSLTDEEIERLRSLGYLGGDDGGEAAPAAREDSEAHRRPDPKDMIGELNLLRRGKHLLDSGDPVAALEVLDEILDANPGNHQARSHRVVALMETGRLDEAEREARIFLDATRDDPEASQVLRHRGMGLLAGVYHRQGRIAEAERQYREILEEDPDAEGTAVDLANLLLESGRRNEAGRIVAELLERNPDSGIVLSTKFVIEADSGDDAAALATARRLAEVRAGVLPVLARAGQMLFEAGEPGPAAECFGAAAEQGAPDPDLLSRLGRAQMHAGRLEAARESFLALYRLDPTDPRPSYFLGAVALDMGDEEEARFRFDQTVRLDPGFTLAPVTLARWLDRQGRRDEALALAREIVREHPDDPQARRLLDRLDRERGSGAGSAR